MSAALALLPRLIRSSQPPLPPAAPVLLGAPLSAPLLAALDGVRLLDLKEPAAGPPAAALILDERLAAAPDDEALLSTLVARLAPGAPLFLALPFDPDRFGPRDEAAGWRRRYTRADLRGLLHRVGCQVERDWVAPPLLAGRAALLDRLGSRLDWGDGVAVRARTRHR